MCGTDGQYDVPGKVHSLYGKVLSHFALQSNHWDEVASLHFVANSNPEKAECEKVCLWCKNLGKLEQIS